MIRTLIAAGTICFVAGALMIHDIVNHSNDGYSCQDKEAWMESDEAKTWLNHAMNVKF